MLPFAMNQLMYSAWHWVTTTVRLDVTPPLAAAGAGAFPAWTAAIVWAAMPVLLTSTLMTFRSAVVSGTLTWMSWAATTIGFWFTVAVPRAVVPEVREPK